MITRACDYCGGSLLLVRADSRFCSPKCRVYGAREAQKLPEMMQNSPRFVRFDAQKVPLTLAGTNASSTNPSTWSSWADARGSTVGKGLGFVLNGDGIGCIDLDKCIQKGLVASWAQEIVDANEGTFIEISVSGTGIHVWGLLADRPGRVIRDGRNIEVYTTGRYIAIGTPLRGTSRALQPLVLPTL